MELFEKADLAMWSLRRTIERSRHLQLATAQLAVEIHRRQQAERLHLPALWIDAVRRWPADEPETS